MIVDPSADDRLDRAFTALADPFEITKQAVSKHIAVLEQAGLVTRTRDAQRRPVHLNADQLEALTAWIDKYRLIHEQQFRSLDALLETIDSADQQAGADPEEQT